MKASVPQLLLLAAATIVFAFLVISLVSSESSFVQFLQAPASTNATKSAQPLAVDDGDISASPPPDLPRCGHSLLFSSARHGSTWLIDSIEQCRFQNSGKYLKANDNSELWVPGHKLLANATVQEAMERLDGVCSLKVFPITLSHLQDMEKLVVHARDSGAPIMVLRRDPKSVYVSLMKAREQGVWNRVAPGGTDVPQDDLNEADRDFVAFQQNKLRYFEKVLALLKRFDVQFDLFEYEEVSKQEFIVAQNNGCYVHNCNFL